MYSKYVQKLALSTPLQHLTGGPTSEPPPVTAGKDRLLHHVLKCQKSP